MPKEDKGVMGFKNALQRVNTKAESEHAVRPRGKERWWRGGKGSRRGLQSRQHLRQRESHYELSPWESLTWWSPGQRPWHIPHHGPVTKCACAVLPSRCLSFYVSWVRDCIICCSRMSVSSQVMFYLFFIKHKEVRGHLSCWADAGCSHEESKCGIILPQHLFPKWSDSRQGAL